MTDESAFLRAVCDSPEDDLPRLVYADWLEENAVVRTCPACSGKGDGVVYSPPGRGKSHVGRCINCEGSGHLSDGRAERAEFIRVQCDLARPIDRSGVPLIQRHRDGAACGCRECILRRRGRELLDAGVTRQILNEWPMPSSWILPLADSVRRGFVERVLCPARTFLEHCHDVRNACPLRESTLTGDVDPDWFRGFVMSGGGRRGEGVRLCEGKAELGIVEQVYHAHRGDRRSEWGRKLFLDLLHAEFRGVGFRLEDGATVREGGIPGLSTFPECGCPAEEGHAADCRYAPAPRRRSLSDPHSCPFCGLVGQPETYRLCEECYRRGIRMVGFGQAVVGGPGQRRWPPESRSRRQRVRN